MKRKVAGLLIATMAIEILFSGVFDGNPYMINGGSGIVAEAANKKQASSSNILDEEYEEENLASASQITLLEPSQKENEGIENADIVEEIEFVLEKEEIQYEEKIEFVVQGISDEDIGNLSFFAEKEGEDEKRIFYSLITEESDSEERRGELYTDFLELGDWTISVYLYGEKLAETILKIVPQKYTLTFLKILTKQLGQEDPNYLSNDLIVIKDKDGKLIPWPLNITKLLRKEGEDVGIYEITGIEIEDEHKEFTVVQNQYSKLEIQKRLVTNRSAKYYMDANSNSEITVDILNHKDNDGNLSVPQDIENPKIVFGEMNEELKQALSEEPVIDENRVTMKLAVPAVKRSVQVPFIIQSDNYQDLTFVIHLQVDYLKERTKEEIKSFYKEHPFKRSSTVTFEESPSFSPYKEGRISKKSEQDGLNALNFVRFIAGISSDVSIDEEMAELAQAASVVMARNDELSHYPKQPSDMPDAFFEKAALGARSSNIAWGSNRLSLSKTIEMYMDDGDEKNIDRVGHRRWCLNPGMKYTGFGFYRDYSALYAFDGSREEITEGYVSWPGKVMPYEYFDGPWSIQFNSNSYHVDENIKVVLKLSSGKTMTFSKADADGYFSFNSVYYGMGPAVIFKPSSSIGKNETVEVQVTGLQRPDGTETEINYTVTFFSMSSSDSSNSGGGSGGGSGGSGGGSGGGGSHSGSSSTSRTGTGVTGPGTTTLQTTGVYGYDGLWILNGKNWNLLMNNGKFASSQWVFVNNQWYIFDQNSIMLTGWQNVDNQWYYMNADGAMMSGWILSNHKWYYLGTNGIMYASTITPDGYQVNADGAWVIDGIVQTQ